jgi:hypothetical protein
LTVHTDRNFVVTGGAVRQVQRVQEDSGIGIALVRNPFDRLVSSYVNKVVQGNSGLPRPFYEAKTFPDFVHILLEQQISARLDGHIRPQHYYLDGRKLDLIGRFEEIMVAWKRICVFAGKELGLPVTNASIGRQDYHSYYTPELVAKVGQFYATDFDRYGYQF